VRVRGLIVVTCNVSDFDGRGVRLINPFRAVCRQRN
jgi:hypothetical protein